MLVTFSGLDGAGKSTLIQGLRDTLTEGGYQVSIVTMYDHVGLYAVVRGLRGRLLRKKTRSSRAAARPLRLLLKASRQGSAKRLVYPVDLAMFAVMRFYLERLRKRIIIADRFFYDTLADVSDGPISPVARLLLAATPTPDLPVFVDVSPRDAFARKGEYPVDYMERRREKYRRIFSCVSGAFILANDDFEQALGTLRQAVAERLPGRRP